MRIGATSGKSANSSLIFRSYIAEIVGPLIPNIFSVISWSMSLRDFCAEPKIMLPWEKKSDYGHGMWAWTNG